MQSFESTAAARPGARGPRTIVSAAAALAIAGALALTGANAAAAAPPPPRFVVPFDTSSGGTLPQRLAVADFDGDGINDVAAANQGPVPLFGSSIGVALGDGNGGLSAPVTTDLPSGEGACSIAAGDFDNTGGTDVAVLSCTTDGAGPIYALTADGDGSFTLVQTLSNAANGQVASGDFNGDGTDDLAFSERGSAEVRIYVGKGDGTFKTPQTMSTTWDSYDLEVGDVDGNGTPDLVGASGGPVWTMLNDGAGHFGPQVFDFSQELSGLELTLGRFDRDANLDVAVVDASGGHVFIGLGQGNGHFTPGKPIGPLALQVTWIDAGDVTGDGRTDLVVDVDSSSSAILVGNGKGAFPKRSVWAAGSDGLTVADLDGRAPLDVVSFSTDPGVVHATVATKKGLRAGRLIKGPAPHVAADLNGDGRIDKVSGVTVFQGGIVSEIVAQLNKGKGKFGPQKVTKVRDETAASGIGAIAVADIDEDGTLDVVGGFSNFQPSPNNLFWMIGKGDGTFSKPTLSTSGDVNADVESIAVGDVDGDNHVDIVSHTLSQVSTRLGNGDGTFGHPIVSGSSGPAQPATLLADVTGDGDLDAVIVHRTGGEDFGSSDILLEKGNGDGTFALVQTRSVDSNISRAAVADLDGDGRPDVAAIGSRGSNGGRNALWILLTTPSGQLGAPVPYGGPAGGLAIADFNGDGAPDIAVNGLTGVTIYVNAGDGAFPTTTSFLSSGAVAVAADFTGDGAPDLTSTSAVQGGYFGLYVNAG
jgi:hypothetical protein